MRIGSKVTCTFDYRTLPVPLGAICNNIPHPGPVYTISGFIEEGGVKVVQLEECPVIVTIFLRMLGYTTVGFDPKHFREIDSMEGIDELIEKALDKKPELQPA
jgi:hypothetical protein